MKNNTITKPNNSFHNACILNDTGNRGMMDEKLDIKPEYFERLTTDDCGNIRKIDGRNVTGGNLTYSLA